MTILQFIMMNALAIVLYYTARYYLNKHYDFNMPPLTKRYHDNPNLSGIQAILVILSILGGYFIVKLFS